MRSSSECSALMVWGTAGNLRVCSGKTPRLFSEGWAWTEQLAQVRRTALRHYPLCPLVGPRFARQYQSCPPRPASEPLGC